jgi:molybdenum cofactor biosynthesis enzyme MoaA
MLLTDPFGRDISYLRVSVTDRCDFRCHYCMSEDMTFLPKSEVLSLEELDRLCSAFIRKGVRKLRLTGGEPLVRGGIMDLIRNLSRHLNTGALDELTLTTNGSQLAKHAKTLVECGIRRINVSMDTLDAEKFRNITRWGNFEKVTAGIDAALAAGLKVKINTVAVNGFNDSEFDDLIAWCGDKGADLTLIETMPLGDIGGIRADQYLPLSQVREKLAENWTLIDSDYRSGGPARYATVECLDLDGNKVVHEAEGLFSRCLQHEIDHLDGLLFVKKMTPGGRIQAKRKLRELENRWGPIYEAQAKKAKAAKPAAATPAQPGVSVESAVLVEGPVEGPVEGDEAEGQKATT